METTRHAWYENNYEGKALRKVFTRLYKRFDKVIEDPNTDLDDLTSMAHMLAIIAKAKADLAKPENEFIDRLKEVESHIGIGKQRVSGVLVVK